MALMLIHLLAHRVVSHDAGLYPACVRSLAIASVLMLVRTLESVCISTQRAFERYGNAIRISLLIRVATVILAAVLTRFGLGIVGIMLMTVVLMSTGTVAQFVEVRRLIKASHLWPAFDRVTIRALFGFGVFSWLQAISSVVLSQVDRLFLGVSLGATAVTSYALCVQMAQPIYGFAAAGLHFLFPYLAARRMGPEQWQTGKAICIALAANLLFVLCSTSLVVSAGPLLLKAWVGQDVARASAAILSPVAWSFALLGLGVTGYYALLAMGHVRTVALLNLVGGVAMLLTMAWLMPRMGIRGVAIARLEYGFLTLGMYVPLAKALFNSHKRPHDAKVLLPTSEAS
jgi:O-antigen/teichoic acid export membrane protein